MQTSLHRETTTVETITLYGFPPSTYTRTARMAAHEKGVAAELLPIAYGQPEHFALHPFGKMPAMTHGDVTLFETLAIVSYIDDVFDGVQLIPKEAERRAEALGAISVAIDYAYQPVVHTRTDGDAFDADDLAAASRVLDWLERRMADSDHIAAGAFTAADLFFAPMVDYHRGKTGDDMTFGKRPNLARWFKAMSGRPSFAATTAV